MKNVNRINGDKSSNLFFRKLQPLLLFGKIIGICGIGTIFVNDLQSLKREANSLVWLAIGVRFSFCAYSILNSIHDKAVDIEEQMANMSNMLATMICLYSDGILIRVILKMDNHVGQRESNCVYGCFIVCVILCVHMSGAYDLLSNSGEDWMDDAVFVKLVCVVYNRCGCIVMIVEFLLFAAEIKRQFDNLIEELNKMIVSKTTTEANVEWCRNQYEFLICTVEDMNSSVGLRLLIPICVIPVELLVYFYRLVFEKKWQMSFLDLSILVVYLVAIHSIAAIGSQIKKIVRAN